MFDLREPHGAYMAQGIGVRQGEAQNHDIGPRGEKRCSVQQRDDMRLLMERKRNSKKVDAESPNTLSDDVKTCLMCLWKELVQQLQGILGECGSHKACGCVSETGASGLLRSVVHLCYVNLLEPTKATRSKESAKNSSGYTHLPDRRV